MNIQYTLQMYECLWILNQVLFSPVPPAIVQKYKWAIKIPEYGEGMLLDRSKY